MDLISAYWDVFAIIKAGGLQRAENIIDNTEQLTEPIVNLLSSQISLAEMKYTQVVDTLEDNITSLNSQPKWVQVLAHYQLAQAYAEIEQLELAEKHYLQGLDTSNNIESLDDPLKVDIKITRHLCFAVVNWHKGDLDLVNLHIDQLYEIALEHTHNKDYRVQLAADTLRGRRLIRTGMVNEAHKIFDKLLDVVNNYKLTNYHGEILRNLAVIHLIRGEIDVSKDQLGKALSIFEETSYKPGIAKCFSLFASISSSKGKLDLAKSYFDKAEKIYKQLNLKIPLAKLFNNRAILLHYVGEMEESLKYNKKSLDLKSELGNHLGMSVSLTNIGAINSLLGNYNEALRYFNRALEIQKANNLYRNIAETKLNIGVVYREQSKLDKALKYLNEALEIDKELGNQNAIGRDFQNIADVYRIKTQYLKSKEYLERSLAIREQIDRKPEIADVLYHLVQVSLKLEERDNANQYFDQLKQLTEIVDSKKYHQKLAIAEAILLKSTHRLKDKTKAQLILEEVIENGITTDDHLVAYIHLIDILIMELAIDGRDEVLNEIRQLIDNLKDITEDQNLVKLKVEISIIEAQIHLIDHNINEAIDLFKEALEISQKHDLIYLSDKINSEITELQNNINEWKAFLSKEGDVMEKIKRSQVQEYLQKVINLM